MPAARRLARQHAEIEHSHPKFKRSPSFSQLLRGYVANRETNRLRDSEASAHIIRKTIAPSRAARSMTPLSVRPLLRVLQCPQPPVLTWRERCSCARQLSLWQMPKGVVGSAGRSPSPTAQR